VDVTLQQLDHPPVFRVNTIIGVADFYKTIGYKVIIPEGLEGDIVQLESSNKWPILIFQKSDKSDIKLKHTSINLKVTITELNTLRKKLHFIGNETTDPNDISIKFYT